jgi:hypothetical protein
MLHTFMTNCQTNCRHAKDLNIGRPDTPRCQSPQQAVNAIADIGARAFWTAGTERSEVTALRSKARGRVKGLVTSAAPAERPFSGILPGILAFSGILVGPVEQVQQHCLKLDPKASKRRMAWVTFEASFRRFSVRGAKLHTGWSAKG